MPLNTQVGIPNPTKAFTIGPANAVKSIQAAPGSYAVLYTVSASQTLFIEDGTFSFHVAETSGLELIYVRINIFINTTKKIPVYLGKVAASGVLNDTVSLKDLVVTPIPLSTGDTIHIEYVYEFQDTGASLGVGAGEFEACLLIHDYQA